MLLPMHWFTRSLRTTPRPRRRHFRRRRYSPQVEPLEERCVPATTYSVNSLLDANVGVANAGTLRYVINQANTNNTGTAAAPDLIQFAVAGVISVGATTGSPLPALTDIAII